MSQQKYDVYELLIHDKNEIIKKIKPGARMFLAYRDMFGENAEEPFKLAFKEYIVDCLKYIAKENLNLTLEEVSDVIDDNNDDCITVYYNKETYL